tara:strand:- start:1 stop:120 length:120 start_codon:yes stop_codon:yes gene_type:complete
VETGGQRAWVFLARAQKLQKFPIAEIQRQILAGENNPKS